MESTLYEDSQDILSELRTENARFAATYPGDRPDRQPIHTVYGGAQLYKAETTRKLGEIALRILGEYGEDARTFGKALGIRKDLRERVYERVLRKLEREPVEDFRIDFEDGYGHR
ncbi:MAG: phosphoenolpyruvate kinase, partial [Myxococcales bacterium]|nr:phosphoenolpyruvate kinase [Myxococcales bacterium]